MHIKRWFATIILLTTLASACYAGGPSAYHSPCPPLYNGGFGLGISWSSYVFSDFSLAANYTSDYFLINVAAQLDNLLKSESKKRRNFVDLILELGLRHRVYQNLFFTYGAVGAYGWATRKPENRHDPYAMGIFVGLDWQALRHFLMSFKINPYLYTRDNDLDAHNTIFEQGSLTFSYIF